MNYIEGSKRIIFYLLILVSFICLPGIISTVGNEHSFLKGNYSEHWLWNFEDFQLSFIEAGCSLPFSNCEYRPFHRRILSYIIVNALTCFICALIYYPGYVAGQILPLPQINIQTFVRIGRLEFGV
ncbi:uncharacterized protein [Parasteatoda tepidariorum]|uniref:uncharacterized protein n=1 Tax=Parasteatoda tepidariorum TaxID=114398 RepID=UPI001C726C31|nr:uncharacterized protein LOC107451616 [Parasteatoda tepidariorum]